MNRICAGATLQGSLLFSSATGTVSLFAPLARPWGITKETFWNETEISFEGGVAVIAGAAAVRARKVPATMVETPSACGVVGAAGAQADINSTNTIPANNIFFTLFSKNRILVFTAVDFCRHCQVYSYGFVT